MKIWRCKETYGVWKDFGGHHAWVYVIEGTLIMKEKVSDVKYWEDVTTAVLFQKVFSKVEKIDLPSSDFDHQNVIDKARFLDDV
jgi:hypothetical protein